jgi:hypothetical protein
VHYQRCGRNAPKPSVRRYRSVHLPSLCERPDCIEMRSVASAVMSSIRRTCSRSHAPRANPAHPPMPNLPVVPICRTCPRLRRRANHKQRLAHPASMKGRFGRSSRTVGRGCDGRGDYVRRTWRTRTAKSRGPDLPTLGSSLAVMTARRRWLSSPDTGELV